MARRTGTPLLPVALATCCTLLLVLARPASCGAPVLVPVSKDAATSLYTIPVRDGASHVIDLAGPLLWSTCADGHLAAKISCEDEACKLANAYHAPSCGTAGPQCKNNQCKAYPYNPITGKCAGGAKLVHTRLVANTTDGSNPLEQVSVRAVGACASDRLLPNLPKGAVGVAGLSAAGLALPAQIARSQGVANKFLLCLPRTSTGEGVAVFGGGPFSLLPTASDITPNLQFVPLHSRPDSPLYYISVESVVVDMGPVPFPAGALSAGGVALCTRVPYTALRPDLFRPFVDAYAKAMGDRPRVESPPAPFGLCYKKYMLSNIGRGHGYQVPSITLMLEGGKRWDVPPLDVMVDVDDETACLAFVEMKGVKAGDPSAAAVIIGGFQMENHILQFDLEKQQFGFADPPYVYSYCTDFNFTRKSY